LGSIGIWLGIILRFSNILSTIYILYVYLTNFKVECTLTSPVTWVAEIGVDGAVA
jgi:hypothetical protein